MIIPIANTGKHLNPRKANLNTLSWLELEFGLSLVKLFLHTSFAYLYFFFLEKCKHFG